MERALARRTLHRKQLCRLLFPHEKDFPDIAAAEQLNLLEAARIDLDLSQT
jgi:hypothetical protein